MKKIVLAVAIAMAGAWGIYQANQNNTQLSDLQLENVEALAQTENYQVDVPFICYTTDGTCYTEINTNQTSGCTYVEVIVIDGKYSDGN